MPEEQGKILIYSCYCSSLVWLNGNMYSSISNHVLGSIDISKFIEPRGAQVQNHSICNRENLFVVRWVECIPWQHIKVPEPVFLALYPPRIDQHMKVSLTSKAFWTRISLVGFREGITSPWCLRPWALSSSRPLLRRSDRQRSLATVIISGLMFSHKMPHTEKRCFYFSFQPLLQLGKVRETVWSKMKAYAGCQFWEEGAH